MALTLPGVFEQLRLYPLTAAQIAQAVNNSGYLNYKAQDFENGLTCVYVSVMENGKPCACYEYSYFDDNEDRVLLARVYVYTNSEQGKPGLYADW